VGLDDPVYFQQKCFYYELLNAPALPEHAFGMDIQLKMFGLDDADNPGLFPCLRFSGLAVRQMPFGIALGKSPFVPAVGIHQKKFDGGRPLAVAHRSYLQRQCNSWQPVK